MYTCTGMYEVCQGESLGKLWGMEKRGGGTLKPTAFSHALPTLMHRPVWEGLSPRFS